MSFSYEVKYLAWIRYEGKCQRCGAFLQSISDGRFHHRLPEARSGESTLHNCLLLCAHCHQGLGSQDSLHPGLPSNLYYTLKAKGYSPKKAKQIVSAIRKKRGLNDRPPTIAGGIGQKTRRRRYHRDV